MSTYDNDNIPVCMYCDKPAYLTGWDREKGDISLCEEHFFGDMTVREEGIDLNG